MSKYTTSIHIRIPAGMLFRRKYCVHCGTRLKKQKLSGYSDEVDTKLRKPPFQKIGTWRRRFFMMGSSKEVSFVYRCPNCNKCITYEEQLRQERLRAQQDSVK